MRCKNCGCETKYPHPTNESCDAFIALQLKYLKMLSEHVYGQPQHGISTAADDLAKEELELFQMGRK